MITIEELLELPAGTVIYVAAPGRGPKSFWANNLSEETFQSVRITNSIYHIMVSSGGYSYNYVRNGEALFLQKSEAEEYMKERHNAVHVSELAKLSRQIEALREKFVEMCDQGAGEPDYVYHKRCKDE